MVEMNDGAFDGKSANTGLIEVLGGEESDKRMSVAEMREWILSAPDDFMGDYDYDDVSRIIAKLTLRYLEAHPEHQCLGDGKYELDPPGDTIDCLREIEPSLYDTMKKNDPDLAKKFARSGMTGFMWGWAHNAARRCLDLSEVPNPALLTI